MLSLEDFSYMDSTTWIMSKVAFKTNVGGNIRYMTLLASRDTANKKFHMLICDISSFFKLADDMMIINKSKSILGGIYENSQDIIKKVPRDLTEEDTKALMNILFVISFKTLAENFGIKLSLPESN
jgi:hypothetical protein